MNIYNHYLNANTKNYDGLEWVIDGENGRYTYPGTYPVEYCKRLYMQGKSWESMLREHKKEMEKLNKR